MLFKAPVVHAHVPEERNDVPVRAERADDRFESRAVGVAVRGRQPAVREHADAAVPATEQCHGLLGAQERRLRLQRLERLPCQQPVVGRLREHPADAQQPHVPGVKRIHEALVQHLQFGEHGRCLVHSIFGRVEILNEDVPWRHWLHCVWLRGLFGFCIRRCLRWR